MRAADTHGVARRLLAGAALCACAAATLAGAPPIAAECAAHLSNNTVHGTGQITDANVSGLGACCALCTANAQCAVFTFAPVPVKTHSAGVINCWIKDNARGTSGKSNRITGVLTRPPPPPPPPPAPPPPPSPPLKVAVSWNTTAAVGLVRADFLSFTMDGHSSGTPCFDGGRCWAGGTLQTAPFEHPRLRAAARHLAPALLRLGGSPFNSFVYDFPPGAGACVQAGAAPSGPRCINATLWDRVAAFARSANISVFFNLNYASWKQEGAAQTPSWNSTNAEAFLAYSVARHGPGPSTSGKIKEGCVGRFLDSVCPFTRAAGPHGVHRAARAAGQSKRNRIARHSFVIERLLPGLFAALSLGNEIHTPGEAFISMPAAVARAWGAARPLPIITGRDTASVYNGYPDPAPFLNATRGSVGVYNYHHYMARSSDKGVVQSMLSPQMLGPQVDPGLLNLTHTALASGARGVWLSEGSYAAHSGRSDADAAYIGALWYLDRLAKLARNGR